MTTLTRVAAMCGLVDAYNTCWRPNAPNYESGSIYENNDLGCESNQLFKNFDIETLSYDELCNVPWLLTRELRSQINFDHYILWSWTSTCASFQQTRKAFPSGHWLNDDADIMKALNGAVHLILSSTRSRYSTFSTQVNDHTLITHFNRFLLAGPICCSILEGLMRRKNNKYVDANGIVTSSFNIGPIQYSPKGNKGKHKLNQLMHSLLLFENYTLKSRSKACNGLVELKNEILGLFPHASDTYDLISSWRNTLQHGNTFWQNKVPVLLNFICLMIIDEFEAPKFNALVFDLKKEQDWQKNLPRLIWYKEKMPYPPDF